MKKPLNWENFDQKFDEIWSTFFNEIGEYDRRFVDDSTSDRAIFSTELDSTNTTRSHGIGVLAGAPDDGNVDFRFRSEPSSPRQSNHLDSLGSLGASSSLCDRESLRQNSHEIPNFSMHALGSSAASSSLPSSSVASAKARRSPLRQLATGGGLAALAGLPPLPKPSKMPTSQLRTSVLQSKIVEVDLLI